jgi:REP-associated tyrosine transposase
VELSALGRIVHECWIEIPKHFSHVELGPQVVMPDHVHGIVIIHTPAMANPAKTDGSGMRMDGNIPAKDERRARYIVPLRGKEGVREFGASVAGSIPTIVATFKAAVSRKRTRRMGRAQPTLWQRGYYEHVIRDEQDFANACAYIRSNPARRAFEQQFPWKHVV